METFRWAGWRDEAKKKWWEAGWTKPMLDPLTLIQASGTLEHQPMVLPVPNTLPLPLPGSYGCAYALGTGQNVGWCSSVSLAFIVVI